MLDEVVDLKAFVPAQNFELSKGFYQLLGFGLNWESDQVAELQLGEFRFLLQNFYVEQLAANFMLQLTVTDLDQWWTHLQEINLTTAYPDATAKAPEVQPWGLKVLYLTDPSGVLWHITEQAREIKTP